MQHYLKYIYQRFSVLVASAQQWENCLNCSNGLLPRFRMFTESIIIQGIWLRESLDKIMSMITLFLKSIYFCQVLSNHIVKFISFVVFSVISIPFEKSIEELQLGKEVGGK